MNSREQFEAQYDDWAGIQAPQSIKDLRMGDSYLSPKASRAWIWWQASRAAVVVTGLSVDQRELAIGDPAECAINYAIQRIEAAGLKVAP